MELNILKNIRQALLEEWRSNPSDTIVHELERITLLISEIVEKTARNREGEKMKYYEIGDVVTMTDDALENYGEEYRDVKLTINHTAQSTDEHPGYDNGVFPMKLYDLDELEFSLYDWELEPA